MASVLKVDQIQSDTGTVNVASNLASVTISNNIESPLKITTSFNEKVRLISPNDAANEHQSITGYNAGNYYWALSGGKDSSNNPFVSILSGTSGSSLSERIKVTGAGVVELPNGQLKFPASQNPSADPNTLDDYEEGFYIPTFTPDGGSVTVSTSWTKLAYVKIGRIVHLYGEIRFSAAGSPTGSMRMSLPFTTMPDGTGSGEANFLGRGAGLMAAFSFGSINSPPIFKTTGNSSTVEIIYVNSGSNTVGASQFSGNEELSMFLTYLAN